MDLTEAEEIKKWLEYTKKTIQKDINDKNFF